jgi:hypothetical protein
MAPSCLNATGIGIKIPSIFLLLAIKTPFTIEKAVSLIVINISTLAGIPLVIKLREAC